MPPVTKTFDLESVLGITVGWEYFSPECAEKARELGQHLVAGVADAAAISMIRAQEQIFFEGPFREILLLKHPKLGGIKPACIREHFAELLEQTRDSLLKKAASEGARVNAVMREGILAIARTGVIPHMKTCVDNAKILVGGQFDVHPYFANECDRHARAVYNKHRGLFEGTGIVLGGGKA